MPVCTPVFDIVDPVSSPNLDMSKYLKAPKEILIKFILSRVGSPAHLLSDGGIRRPVLLGLQGPQGIGKTWLSNQITEELTNAHKIHTIVLSLDDFYWTRQEQQKIEEQDQSNRLIKGRGLPGTHDLNLAENTLNSLLKINQIKETTLPHYDKSAYNGLGDRKGYKKYCVPTDETIQLIIFEGWMVGFLPIDPVSLRNVYDRAKTQKLNASFAIQYSIEELMTINESLKPYVDRIWNKFDCLVNLIPQELNFVWRWRAEQEAEMKSTNGGIGMSEQEVEKFVSRYMPCYELFGKGSKEGDGDFDRGMSSSLMLIISQERKVVEIFPKSLNFGNENSIKL